MNSSAWSDAEALAYIASYRDLRLVLGADPAAGRRHFADQGATEGRGIGFDPYGYLATYADLRGAFGSDIAAAARHYIVIGAGENRGISFDALGYIASYADLRSAFGTDVAAATRHYATIGARENRVISFDALGYLASHADLRATIGIDTAAATRHFITIGAREGRGVTFDALGYLASYDDLRAAFGTNVVAATRHYVTQGIVENRSVSFDGLAYIASYADLRDAFGADSAAGTRHFIQSGASEGRVINFDPVAYLFSHGDLRAVGMDAAAAARHFIQFGAAEGRSAAGSFGVEQVNHALPVGRTITGTIDRSGDRDWYKVELAAGQGATFSFFGLGITGALTVHDAFGRVQAVTQTGARSSFLPTADGTYYITITPAGTATGQYALLVDPMFTIVGTGGSDTLTGTGGDDRMQGLAGNDTLNGRAGNDILEGGEGYDQLDGGLGNDILYGNNAANTGFDGIDYLTDTQGGDDRLYGQDGNDSLSVSRYEFNGAIAASNVVLDGGLGDDDIRFNSSRFTDTVTITGGAGNDTINVGSALRVVIDAGDGNDKVTVGTSGGEQTVTLGSGADVLTLQGVSSAIAIGNQIRVTDFTVGTDAVALDQYLSAVLTGWDSATNPFGTGHLRLVQSGADTLLQVDRDGTSGSAYSAAGLMIFSGTTATGFTARDLGYAPIVDRASAAAVNDAWFDAGALEHQTLWPNAWAENTPLIDNLFGIV